ncbi:MAG TPA: 3D domain-containing protein [Caulobacteraceae bacterium]
MATAAPTAAAVAPAPTAPAGDPDAATPAASATPAADPLGDLIGSVLNNAIPGVTDYLKATLYHAGRRMSALDSLGCKVVPMRTAAVDGVALPRHTILFIKDTVGMTMPDGSKHDGYWYASDVGGAIHKGRIDLFTGDGKGSMAPLMALNLTTLKVIRAGVFHGCPPN